MMFLPDGNASNFRAAPPGSVGERERPASGEPAGIVYYWRLPLAR
jgi:hypothetical protein